MCSGLSRWFLCLLQLVYPKPRHQGSVTNVSVLSSSQASPSTSSLSSTHSAPSQMINSAPSSARGKHGQALLGLQVFPKLPTLLTHRWNHLHWHVTLFSFGHVNTSSIFFLYKWFNSPFKLFFIHISNVFLIHAGFRQLNFIMISIVPPQNCDGQSRGKQE